jgi:DNA-binding MarR family transcriptional regulator
MVLVSIPTESLILQRLRTRIRAVSRGNQENGSLAKKQAEAAGTERVASLVARFRRLVSSAATRRLEREGRSIHEHRVLAELTHNGPRRQGDLADATAQHPAAISRLIDELEERALVRRRRDTTDRRQVIVELTREGRARFRAERPMVRGAIDEVLSPLGPRDQRRLVTLLEAVLSAHAAEPGRKRPTPTSRRRRDVVRSR